LFDSTRTGKWGYGDKADAEMAARFDAFSPAAKKFIQDIFAHGDRMLQRKKDIVLDATRSEFDAQIANAKTDKEKAELRKAKQLALKRYETLFRIREGRPYAPIKRTGNYVVIAKSREYMEAERNEDAARIKELARQGFNVIPAAKGKGRLGAGIALLQSLMVYTTPDSTNLIAEMATYSWEEDKNGNMLDKPVPLNDHAIDALRYAVWSTMKKRVRKIEVR
jgi:hypothetical protein